MRPLRIGPDGLVESATSRETAHLTYRLGQACQPMKPRRNKPKDAVTTDSTISVTSQTLKICPLCKSNVREDRLQRHLNSRCASRPNKPSVQGIARTVRKMKSSAGNRRQGKKQHRTELSSEEMQRIFESTMASAGRYGSSRQH
jgi:hypothetical protein